MRPPGPYREPRRDGAETGSRLVEESLHPHMILATERIKDWQREAARSRLAREARRGRRAWMMPYAARLVLLRSRLLPSAPLAAGRRSAGEQRSTAAGEPRSAAAAERRPESTRVA